MEHHQIPCFALLPIRQRQSRVINWNRGDTNGARKSFRPIRLSAPPPRALTKCDVFHIPTARFQKKQLPNELLEFSPSDRLDLLVLVVCFPSYAQNTSLPRNRFDYRGSGGHRRPILKFRLFDQAGNRIRPEDRGLSRPKPVPNG
uniref:Uncharacterized protein n=1 Tax=Steinernema glaseri TaxID=37863 RepID=A0A1I7ZB50_9BILA